MKMPLHRLRAQLPILLVVASLLLCSEAVWIYAKAQVAQLLIARAWNRSLTAPDEHHKPWQWADTWPVLRLQWQDPHGGGSDLFVLAGADGSSLAFGPGLLGNSTVADSPMTVIAAHRDTHFAFLEQVQPGDTLSLQNSSGAWRDYVVTELSVADTGNSALYIDPGLDALLLITCYPFHALFPGGPLRYLVKAYPVSA